MKYIKENEGYIILQFLLSEFRDYHAEKLAAILKQAGWLWENVSPSASALNEEMKKMLYHWKEKKYPVPYYETAGGLYFKTEEDDITHLISFKWGFIYELERYLDIFYKE